MTVSLVLPCYNPPPGWEKTVFSSFGAFRSRLGIPVELVVVMDGASNSVTKESTQFLEKNITGLRLITYAENKGKGYAIRQGVTNANGDIIIYTDIDFPYTTDSMVEIFQALNSRNTDIAVGVKNEQYYHHVPFLRRLISKYLRALIRIFLSMPITDTQCGLKGFTKNVSPLFLQTTINRYLFDLEFIRNCFRSKKYRVKAIPVTLNENIHFRSMNYRILLSESVNFIRLLFRKPKY